MKTGDLDDGISKQNLVHNGHVAITNELRLAADEFQRSLKEAVKVNSTELIQQLFQQEQAKIAAKFTTEELASFLPSFENMKTSLYRHRAQERPNLPIKLELVLNPKSIMTDMELGAMKAFKLFWSEAKILARLFHVGQAWFKKFSKLGFKQAYVDDKRRNGLEKFLL